MGVVCRRRCERCAGRDYRIQLHRHHVGITGKYYYMSGASTKEEYDKSFEKANILCWQCHEIITKINWCYRKIFWGRKKRGLFDRRNTIGEFKELAKMEEYLYRYFICTPRNMAGKNILGVFLEAERKYLNASNM